MRARPRLPEHYYHPQKGVCRWCGNPILDADGHRSKRRLWHKECLEPYLIATDSVFASQRAWERDQGVCQVCHLNIGVLKKARDTMSTKFYRTKEIGEVEWDKFVYEFRTLGFEVKQLEPYACLSNCDHINPVCMSGGELAFFALANLQTICTPCHGKKTWKDVRVWRAHRLLEPKRHD